MNEYTRREEIHRTLFTVFILVPAIAVAIVQLVRAKGPMVVSKDVIVAAQRAEAAQKRYEKSRCAALAKELSDEVGVFQLQAAQEKKRAEEAANAKKARFRPGPEKVEYDLPWKGAAPVLKLSKALYKGKCKAQSEAATGKNAKADSAWRALVRAARLGDPGDSAKDQQHIARELLKLFDDAPLRELASQAKAAKKKLEANTEQAEAKKKDDSLRVQAPLPEGLFKRGAAIGVGVSVSLAALIISYFSVRSASMRRAHTLVALRRFASTPERGLQAAAIVRLAAHHNGGEPGMVIGAALGGLLAALVTPTDDPNVFLPDLFVAGSMGGLLIGLAAQWLVRTTAGAGRWRERCKELGDIEKPTIPVALVLGGVTPGLEKQFLRYFEALPVGDAAMVVEKLAAQAEEQIIAAAESAAAQQQAMPMQPVMPGASPWGQPPPGMPPGGGPAPSGPPHGGAPPGGMPPGY